MPILHSFKLRCVVLIFLKVVLMPSAIEEDISRTVTVGRDDPTQGDSHGPETLIENIDQRRTLRIDKKRARQRGRAPDSATSETLKVDMESDKYYGGQYKQTDSYYKADDKYYRPDPYHNFEPDYRKPSKQLSSSNKSTKSTKSSAGSGSSDAYENGYRPDRHPRPPPTYGKKPRDPYYKPPPNNVHNPYDPYHSPSQDYNPHEPYYKPPPNYGHKPYDPYHGPSQDYNPHEPYPSFDHGPSYDHRPVQGYDHKEYPSYHHDPHYPFYDNCCFTNEQACEIFEGAVADDERPTDCPDSNCFCPHYVEKVGGYGYHHENGEEEGKEEADDNKEGSPYRSPFHDDKGQVKCLPSFAEYCNQFDCPTGNAACMDVVQQCCTGWCYSCHTQEQKCDAYARVEDEGQAGTTSCDLFKPIICPDATKDEIAFNFACSDPEAFCRAYIGTGLDDDDDCLDNCVLAFARPDDDLPGCCGCPAT